MQNQVQEVNISTLSAESLQALAYRLIRQRDNIDQSLGAIEVELNRRDVAANPTPPVTSDQSAAMESVDGDVDPGTTSEDVSKNV